MFCLPDNIEVFGFLVVLIEENEKKKKVQKTQLSTEDQKGYESGLNT